MKLDKKNLPKNSEIQWIGRVSGEFFTFVCQPSYTIGDADIEIYDTRYESQINERLESGNVDFCSAVSDTGAGLISLKMPFCVHSTAG